MAGVEDCQEGEVLLPRFNRPKFKKHLEIKLLDVLGLVLDMIMNHELDDQGLSFGG